MLKNLEEQAAANEKMAELEQEKKDTDKEKVEEYLEEREKALEEREKVLIEREKAFGGFGGQEDYKSASEEFVDAWLSAFKETGNGLEGLNDKFEEFFLNMLKKQLATRVMEKYMNSLYDFFDDRLSSDGELSKKEREEIRDEWSKTATEASAALQALLESMGVASDIRGKAEMDTLQKGIQGITETQADIIASYLNSIRFFVAEQNSYLQDIAMAQGVSQRENPMVEHLKVVAEQTTAIHNLLDNLLAPHPTQAGRGLKVVI
jgi:predicted RNA-binding protein Jag